MGKQKKHRDKFPDFAKKSIKDSFKLDEQLFSWTLQDCLWNNDCWQLSAQELSERIIAKLQQFETQYWREIKSASGGKSQGNGTNSHFIEGIYLPLPAKKVFIEKGYMRKYENVFSSRLSGKERLIGFVDMAKFHVLWYDPEHEFFPTSK